jgi:hypothetical protein
MYCLKVLVPQYTLQVLFRSVGGNRKCLTGRGCPCETMFRWTYEEDNFCCEGKAIHVCDQLQNCTILENGLENARH